MRALGPDAEHAPERFDALEFIAWAVQTLAADPVAGVASSSDYPGCIVSAFVAQELGLPGPTPNSVLQCSHKYYARIAQREVVPEATPRFELIDPTTIGECPLELPFPVFVKPVKSWFSQHARQIDSLEQLRAYARRPAVRAHLEEFVRPFNQLLELDGTFAFNGSYLLAEEIIDGYQVTLEGYVRAGRITVIGVVDSVMYRGTLSFERFEYPSSITPDLGERMRFLVERVLAYIGFDMGLFNVELRHNPSTDEVRIVEINPRMCAQWADLMERVNGTNTYEVLLSLALDDEPPAITSEGRDQVATSFVLRQFEDAIVARAPDDRALERIRAASRVTSVSTFYSTGDRLSENWFQDDGLSYRYAVINVAGEDRAAVGDEFRRVRAALNFEFVAPSG